MHRVAGVKEALNRMEKDLFAESKGGRLGAKKTVVLMLRHFFAIEDTVQALQDKEFVFIAIGMIDSRDSEYFFKIAHRSNRVLMLRSQGELYPGRVTHKTLVDLLRNPDYDRHDFLTNFQSPELGCKFVADIDILLDWPLLDYVGKLYFVNEVAASFCISTEATHFGVRVTGYSGDDWFPESKIKFNQYKNNTKSFFQNVERLRLSAYQTQSSTGCGVFDANMFSSAKGGREGVTKVFVYITNDIKYIPDVVQLIVRGVKILVIGVDTVHMPNDRTKENLPKNVYRVKVAKETVDLLSRKFIKEIVEVIWELSQSGTGPVNITYFCNSQLWLANGRK